MIGVALQRPGVVLRFWLHLPGVVHGVALSFQMHSNLEHVVLEDVEEADEVEEPASSSNLEHARVEEPAPPAPSSEPAPSSDALARPKAPMFVEDLGQDPARLGAEPSPPSCAVAEGAASRALAERPQWQHALWHHAPGPFADAIGQNCDQRRTIWSSASCPQGAAERATSTGAHSASLSQLHTSGSRLVNYFKPS